MAAIQLKIKADSQQAKKSVDAFRSSTDKLQVDFQKLQAELKDASVDRYTAKIKKLSTVYSVLGDETTGLYKQKNFLKTELTKLLNKGIEPTDKRVVLLRSHYQRLKKETNDLKTRSSQLGVSFKSIAGSTTAILGTVAAVRGVAFAFNGAYTASREFTKEIKNVTTLTNDLTFDEIKKGIQALNPVLGSAAELTEGLYQTISAGVKPAEAIEFVGTAAKFAKAGLTDTKTAVDVLTTSVNAYGLSSKDAAKISDILFATVKAGKTTAAELGSSLGQVIPIFASTGVSIEEVTAGLAAMTQQGIATSEAVTQLRAIATAFLKPSAAMKKALQEQGFASGSALLETQGLSGALRFLNTQSKGSKDALATLLPNIRALNGALALSANESKGFSAALDTIRASVGTTDEALEKQVDAIDIARASLQRAQENFGEFTQTLIKGVSPAIAGVARYLSTIDFAAAAVGIGSVSAAFVAMKVASIAAAGGLVTLKAAFTSTLIGAAIIGLGAGVAFLVNKFSKLKDITDESKESLESLVKKYDSDISQREKKIESLQKKIQAGGYLPQGGLRDLKRSLAAEKKYVETLVAQRQNAVDQLKSIQKKEADNQYDHNKELVDIQQEYQRSFSTLFDQAEATQEKSTHDLAVSADHQIADISAYADKRKKIYEQLYLTEDQQRSLALERTLQYYKEVLDIEDTVLAQIREKEQQKLQASSDARKQEVDDMRQTAGVIRDTLGIVDTSIVGISIAFTSVISAAVETFEILADKSKEFSQQMIAISAEAVSAIGGIVQGIGQVVSHNLRQQYAYQSKLERKQLKEKKKQLDDEKKRRLADIKDRGVNEVAAKRQEEAIEQEYAAKKEAHEKEAAKTQHAREVELFEINKQFQLANIAINSAAAILKVWATSPDSITAGVVTAGIVALTIAQKALVAAQKPPKPPVLAGGTTGEGFIVPSGYDGDTFPVRVRSGERVTVDPVGEVDDKEPEPIILHITIGTQTITKALNTMNKNKAIRI